MDVTKPYKFIGLGAMDVTKPYKFIGFGAMDVTEPYKFIGFGAGGGTILGSRPDIFDFEPGSGPNAALKQAQDTRHGTRRPAHNDLAVLKANMKIENLRIRAGIGPKPTFSLGNWQSGPSPGF